MSFILDALKKSENERQQQSTTEFAAVPSSSGAPGLPRWLWIVGALLAINLAVLIGLFLKPELEAAKPTRSSAMVAEPSVVELEVPSFQDQVAAARRNTPQQQTDITEQAEAEQTAVTVQPDIISRNPETLRSTIVYPTIHEVRASGAFSLPDLHLDIHVYSDAPEDRFVFINMSKHREGSKLSEGPAVSEITPDGVVLDHEGQSFLLPRE